MKGERTTIVVQRYLDELATDSTPEPVVRALLDRAVRRLQFLCSTLLYRGNPRLTQPSPSRTRTNNNPAKSRTGAEHEDDHDNAYGESPYDIAHGVAQILTDPDLARVISAWPDLFEAVRRAVFALFGNPIC
jgi:hypothetical protein